MNYNYEEITEIWFIWGADDDQTSEVPGSINITYESEDMGEMVSIPGNYEDSETDIHCLHVKEWVLAGNTINENKYPLGDDE